MILKCCLVSACVRVPVSRSSKLASMGWTYELVLLCFCIGCAPAASVVLGLAVAFLRVAPDRLLILGFLFKCLYISICMFLFTLTCLHIHIRYLHLLFYIIFA